MCRYACKNYKAHFACFACQKAFKKTSYYDYTQHKGISSLLRKETGFFESPDARKIAQENNVQVRQKFEEMYFADVSTCPECGKKMAALGLDFRPPKKTDKEAWQVISQLYENGYAFQGCGCYVGYAPPLKVKDIPQWLTEHSSPKKDGEKLLASILAKA